MLPIRILKLFSLQTALVASPSLAGAVFMRLNPPLARLEYIANKVVTFLPLAAFNTLEDKEKICIV